MRTNVGTTVGLLLCGVLVAGCSSYGYRHFVNLDEKLRSYPYVGREFIIDKTEERVRYADCNVAILNADQPYSSGWVDSDTVAGGKDAWTGLGLEAGYGQKYVLSHSESRIWWGSIEADYLALRFVYHLSGPEGKPDHRDDRCGVDFRNGVGVLGRIGYGWNRETANDISRFIGPELGIGATWVEGMGMGYQVDARLLWLRW
jgi:hypothetical protein